MKKLSLSLLAVLSAGLFFTSCSNDDNNSEEVPQILVESGNSSKGLFVINNLLDKVNYSNGNKEVFEYNSNNKVSKVTFYTSDSNVLYDVTFNYSSSGNLEFTTTQYVGYNTYKKSSISYVNTTDLNVMSEQINKITNEITQMFNTSLVFNGNNVSTYTTQTNSTNYDFLTTNSYYNQLISIKELAFYYKELAVLKDNISELNIQTEDSAGTAEDYYYEYEFDASNRVSKITKFSTVTDEILETKKVSYN